MSVKLVEPNVYLIGRQTIDENALAAFLADEGVESWETDTDIVSQKLVELGGRCCYMSFSKPRPGGNQAYLDRILESAHGSVLEHSVFNFMITGVSRSFTHELVRHRAGWAYSQLSQRYVDESSCQFVVPPMLRDEVDAGLAFAQRYAEHAGWKLPADPSYTQIIFDLVHGRPDRPSRPDRLDPTMVELIGLRWLSSAERDSEEYRAISDYLVGKLASVPSLDATSRRKQAREAARSVLPNCTETKIFATANVRALRHFLEMRASIYADNEMREVALLVLGILQRESPNLFGDFEVKTSDDGREYAVAKWHKV